MCAYLVNCVGRFQLIPVNFQDMFSTGANKVCTMVSSTMVKTILLKEGFSVGTPYLGSSIPTIVELRCCSFSNHANLVSSQTPPSHEEKRSCEPSRISSAGAHFCDNVT